tara:strand:+ start:2165 stop:2767 length:603 start_codon:yes stop_codon:yes gene_type:complete
MLFAGGMNSVYARRYGKMSDEDLRKQYDRYSSLGGITGGMFGAQRAAMSAEIQRRKDLGDFGLPAEAAAGASQAQQAAAAGDSSSAQTIGALNKRISDLEAKFEGTPSASPVGPIAGGVRGIAQAVKSGALGRRGGGLAGVAGGSDIGASNITPDDDSVSIDAPVTFAAPAQQAAGDIYGSNFARMAAVGAAKMITNKKI